MNYSISNLIFHGYWVIFWGVLKYQIQRLKFLSVRDLAVHQLKWVQLTPLIKENTDSFEVFIAVLKEMSNNTLKIHSCSYDIYAVCNKIF